jgi:hypothetical protein
MSAIAANSGHRVSYATPVPRSVGGETLRGAVGRQASSRSQRPQGAARRIELNEDRIG